MSAHIVGHYSAWKDAREYMLVDMHCHSRFSDGKDDIAVVIAQAKKLGIGLAVTDHNAIQGALVAGKELFSLPGIEVTSNEALDLLVYFEKESELEMFYQRFVRGHRVQQRGLYVQWHKLKWSMPELIEHARGLNAFIVLPHPDTLPPKNSVDYFYQHKDVLKWVDAVEGVNGVMKREANANAMLVAKKWGKPFVGGSDAHLAKFLGCVVTACPAQDRASFFEAIRQQKNVVVGDSLQYFQKFYAGFTTLRRNVGWNF